MVEELCCSFCHRGQQEVSKLVAGKQRVTICDGCIPRARDAMLRRQPRSSDAAAIWFSDGVDGPCGFCGRRVGGFMRRKNERPLDGVAVVGDARICVACLDLCDQIVEQASV